MRSFLLGFALGMVALAAVLWGTGSLRSARWGVESRTVSEASREAPPPAPQQPTPLPDTTQRPPQAPVPVPPPERPAPAAAADLADLAQRRFRFPVPGVEPKQVIDTYDAARPGGRLHEAVDIMAARGTPVVAVDEGNVVKLFNSKQGGLTVYQFDNSRTWCYYYAHLDRYAEGLQEGMLLRRGDRVGYVGSTGDASANAPHLHLAIFKLGPEKRWWEGTPVNPYPFLMNAIIGSK